METTADEDEKEEEEEEEKLFLGYALLPVCLL